MSAHDHRACMDVTLLAAERLGTTLTPLRRRVLEIVLESHKPVGAYDVLGHLARGGKRPAPPTVYRALDFLRAQGFVHRIDSRNAFVACFAPQTAHRSHFLLCRACGRAAEIENPMLDRALEAAAQAQGFAPEHETVEITGKCAECANSASAKPLDA
ncbi:MAG TPA: Fur family transcriptional regulator [Rhizomicrobium sp.]|jgi:Fur family zinc uptake transcriptional regulator|nr:Fur family transcriptional regulator [Rhizomicrobium sp.]